MKKKLIIMTLLAVALSASITACGPKNNGGGENVPPAGFEDVEDKEEAEDIEADTGETDEASAHPLKEYVFSQDVLDKDLEKPIRAYGFEYDEEEDHVYENSLDQFRSDLHLHIGILAPGLDMDTYLDEQHAEHYHAVSTVWGRYNIQQAEASSSDGTAMIALTRYTHFEDDGEDDYEYIGDIVFTDGTSVAATDLLYSIDKEYGDGERVEATVKALAARYGIDYDGLKWTDMESKPAEDEVVYEETQMLTWADKNVSYGPVKTFKLALTTNNGTSVVTHHDSGVTLYYELTDDDGTVEELLQTDIEGAKRIAETVEEGTGFSASPITTAADGTVYSSYTYTDKDGNVFSGTYAYKDSGTEGVWVRIQVYMNPVWGYDEESENTIYDRVVTEFGFTD